MTALLVINTTTWVFLTVYLTLAFKSKNRENDYKDRLNKVEKEYTELYKKYFDLVDSSFKKDSTSKLHVPISALAKLGSLIVHTDELLFGVRSEPEDREAIKTLLKDRELLKTLADLESLCLLPVRRDRAKYSDGKIFRVDLGPTIYKNRS